MRTRSTKLSAIAVLALLVSVVLPIGAASAAAPKISVSNVSLVEGAPGTTKVAKFKVTLSKPAPKKVTVDYETVDGRAKAGKDYIARSGTLTFRTGTDKEVVKVTVKGEGLYELNEAFFLKVSDPTRARIDDAKGKGAIKNDDDPPSLSVDILPAIEDEVAMITFKLSKKSGLPASFSYATGDDSTTEGVDYEGISGDATIPAGQKRKTNVGVQTLGDEEIEGAEIFVLELTEPNQHVTIGEDFDLGQILDEDAPEISIGDVTITETNTAQVVNVEVELSEPHPTEDVTVDYEASEGFATSPEDYSLIPGTLVFEPNDTEEVIQIDVVGDTLDEGAGPDPMVGQSHENFYVDLSNPTNATIADPQGQVVITDDDPMPTFSITNATVSEGDSNFVWASFFFNLSTASGRDVAFNTRTNPPGGPSGTATSGNDFASTFCNGIIPAGQTSYQCNVVVYGDQSDENNENFFLVQYGVTNATVTDGTGEGTITDDD